MLENAQMQLYRPQSGLREALDRLQPVFYDRLDFFGARAALEEWLETHGKSADEVLIARFEGRFGNAWLVFDRRGEYLSYFLNPESTVVE